MTKTHSDDEVAEKVQKAEDAAYQKGKGEIVEAIRGLKKDDRPSGAGGLVQKPPTFIYGQDVSKHLTIFENYRIIAGITDINAMRVYLTYLDDKCQDKLRSLTKAQKDNWTVSKNEVKKKLIPTEQKYKAKTELRRTKQRVTESVEQFTDRIESLANTIYEDTDHEARNATLIDVFLNGLRRAEIRIAILSKHGEEVEYLDASREAKILDASYSSSRMAQEEEDEGGAICATTMERGIRRPIPQEAVYMLQEEEEQNWEDDQGWDNHCPCCKQAWPKDREDQIC